MWCPQCRNEYREGITECADCHVSLVDELPPEEIKNPDSIDEKFVKWANEHPDLLEKIKEQEEKKTDDEGVGDNVDSYSEEDERNEEKMEAAQTLSELGKPVKPYRSKAEKAEDFRSSGWTLLLVGGVGVIAMILIMTGIIPLNLAGNIKYLSYGVMTALFVVFFIMGLKSLKTAKQYQLDSIMEETLTKELREWFLAAFPKTDIDSDTFSGEEDSLEDIEKYYKRIENMKQKITSRYSDLDEAYMDKMADELFHEIYE